MLGSSVASASDALSREDARALVQARLGLFYGVCAAIGVLVTASNLVGVVFARGDDFDPDVAAVVIGTFSLITVMWAGFWWVCRRGARSERSLATMDVAGVLVTTIGTALSSATIPEPHEARFSSIIVVMLFITARAAVVPSSGRRTLALGLACAAIVAAASTLVTPTEGHGAVFTAYVQARVLVIAALLTALTSRVIYGLRREIAEARRLGQYVLDEKIGSGGMGVVYRAHHALLRRETAVKLLPPDRVGAAALARFEREVQMTARLTHPNTVAIYDYGRTAAGVFYYAMEYLDGSDLEEVVSFAGPLPPGRVVFLLEQVCRALAEAHAARLIHRDVKPANVLVCERGGEADVAKILDFGLVKDLGAAVPGAHGGALTGTPLYMSPEAVETPEAVEPRSDLYAVGAVAYFLLTGEPVFGGATLVDVCAHHLHSQPRPPSERLGRSIPADLEALVLRCLAKAPADRPPDARALREALLRCRDVEPWTPAHARAWWDANGTALRARRAARRAADAP